MNSNDPDERAEHHLLGMAVTDAMDHGGALAARIRAHLATARPTLVAAPHRHHFAAAALVALGTGAVFAVAAALRQPSPAFEHGRGGQDPQPKPQPKPLPKAAPAAVRVTSEQLPKRTDYAFDQQPAIDCLVAIAKANHLPLVAAPIETPVTLLLQAKTPLEALAAVAHAAKAHVEQYGAVLAIVDGAGNEELPVTLRSNERPVTELFDLLGHQAKRNLVIDPNVGGSVAVDVEGYGHRDVLAAIAGAVGAEVVGIGPLLQIRPKTNDRQPRVVFAFDRSPTTKVVDTIGKITGSPMVAEAEIAGTVTVQVRDRPALDVLQAVAATQDCVVVEADGQRVWRSGRGGRR